MVVLRYGSRGVYVGKAQTLLNKNGFQLTVDNSFGPAMLRAVKLFQKSKGLTIDGVVGPATWSALNGFSYRVLNGARIVEVDPLDIKIHVEQTSSSSIRLKNFMNATFVYWKDRLRHDSFPISMLIYDGEVIRDVQPNGWRDPKYPKGAPTPTLIVWKNGKVEVKDACDLTSVAKDIHIAVSGVQVAPYVRTQGFVPYVPFSTVAYRTARIGIGYNPDTNKLILCSHVRADASQFRVHMLNAGAKVAITLDSGGSAGFGVSGSKYLTSARIMYAWLTW